MVENAALGHADIAQALFNGFLVERLDAVRLNRCYGRTLHHADHDDVAVLRERHVAEEPRLVERMNGANALFSRVVLAGAERQVGEDRAGFCSRQAFDTDIRNDEGRSRSGEKKGGSNAGRQAVELMELQNELSLHSKRYEGRAFGLKARAA